MLKTVKQLNDEKLLLICMPAESDGLQFYCHNESNNSSYGEKLSLVQLLQRAQQLNKRVQFPPETVRSALSASEPDQMTMSAMADQKVVVGLKYRIEGAPAPLKWEWQVSLINSSVIYRNLFIDALGTATALQEHVLALRNHLQKKDVELNQYKFQFKQLNRYTLATEQFDVDGFDAQIKQLLTDAAAYKQISDLLNTVATPQEATKVEIVDVKPTTSPKTLSPRNRKRKALEIGVNHLERKVLQRRRAPQMEYKDSQSQESDIDKCFEEINQKPGVAAAVKIEGQSSAPLKVKIEAREIGTNQLERKVLQRHRAPQMQYKDSQSPQSDMDNIFEENNQKPGAAAVVKIEDHPSAQINMEEPVADANTTSRSDESLNLHFSDSDDNNAGFGDLDALKKMVQKSIAETKQMMAEHKKNSDDT